MVGGGQDLGAPGLDGRGLAVVDVCGGVQAEPAVTVLVVVPAEELLAVRPACSIEVNRAGKYGRYLRVLNCASENGLSFETWGGVGLGDAEVGEQERDRPGGHRGAAVGVEARCPRPMPCLAQVPAMSFSARAADSRVATIQPTA